MARFPELDSLDTTEVRPSAVAGAFYPAVPDVLRQSVEMLLQQATAHVEQRPLAMIVPHAGYIYSGPIAASAYKALQPFAESIKRVVILGPAHHVAVRALAVPKAGAFLTPLGPVPIDVDALEKLKPLGHVVVSDDAHAREHSLEVQLPFLQVVLKEFKVVPIIVGHASAALVAEVIETLWSPDDTLLLVSSDLSHYLPYGSAVCEDRATADHILSLGPPLDHEHACGASPINGLMEFAKEHGLHARLLDLRNSGDTAGDRSRVVGYASFCFAQDGP